MMMTIDDFRSVLEYNVATMCPNQTCEPVEFLQVRICLQMNQLQKYTFHQVAGLKVDFHIKKGNAGARVANIGVVGEDG